ncbi:MAG: hypothetical protein Phog2KO_47760 [Phototrophicaceae bacterium]
MIPSPTLGIPIQKVPIPGIVVAQDGKFNIDTEKGSRVRELDSKGCIPSWEKDKNKQPSFHAGVSHKSSTTPGTHFLVSGYDRRLAISLDPYTFGKISDIGV